MDGRAERILNDYLADVERELGAVSSSARREFIAEIRSHLLEEWQHSPEQNSAAMLNILERFGDAREIAAEFREKNNLAPVSHAPSQHSVPPVLIVILTIFLWPVGIVLAWLSPAWQQKHKFLATVLPVIAIIALLAFAIPARTYYTSSTTWEYSETREIREDGSIGDIRVEQDRAPGPVMNIFSMFLMILTFSLILIGNPLGSGIYLAATMERAP
ncbi:MAG: hypothetical protein SCK29_03810 [Bacillota bacterium]|nr:hypothetical protein [Bacillota bacterium]MDW7683232.1 hypothetical protein [Bacillota bacterium]